MSSSLALILFLALLLLCPNSAQAVTPVVYVQQCGAQGALASSPTTCTLPAVAANSIIVATAGFAWSTSSGNTVTLSGGGLTWHQVDVIYPYCATLGDSHSLVGMWYAQTTSSGSVTVTWTYTNSPVSNNPAFAAAEYSGADTATPLLAVLDHTFSGSCSGDTVSNPISTGATSVSNGDMLLGTGKSNAIRTITGSGCVQAGTPTALFNGRCTISTSSTRSIQVNLSSNPATWGIIGAAFRCQGCDPVVINPPPPPTGQFIRGVWFLDGSAGSTGGGGGGGTGGGGTEDLMDWVVMDDRRTNHLTPGYSAHYLFGDTVATATAGTNFAWIKNSGGNPWDINHFDNRNLYWWITENGEQAPTNASAYKRFISPVPIAPRYFTPGSTVTITTDGANPIIRTTNCEADHQAAININHIKGVTTGPASTAWGGDVGTADTLLIQYYWGGSGSVYNNLEEHYLVKTFGRVAFKAYTWNGSSYTLTDSTIHNTLALGASPDPNFTCGYTSDWWQLVNGTVGTNPNPLSITSTSPLPNASLNAPYSVTLKAAGGVPPYSWAVSSGSTPTGLTLQTTGTLDGTPSVAGTTAFTAQVTDSVAATFSKAFSITVIDSTTHSVDLSWSAGAGATSYNVYRSTVNGACSPSIASGCSKIGTGITQLSWSDANVTSGQHYFYVVTGVNSAGESGSSNQVSITIP